MQISNEYGFWSSQAADRIAEGTEKWEIVFSCTGVSFNSFEVVDFVADDEDLAHASPPFHHYYWVVAVPEPDPLTGTIPDGRTASDIGFGGRTVGAVTYISPNMAFNPVSSDPSLFNYLGTHEVGHTFNLSDCLSTTTPACLSGQLTIMSGNGSTSFNTSGATACDLNAVRNIYCPTPSPTPEPTPTPEWPWPVIPTEPEPCQNGGWFWNFTNNTCNQDPQQAYCPHHCIPYQPLEQGACSGAADYCSFAYGCPPGTIDGGQGCCCLGTPVLIDVNGDGFKLTDAYSGIMFDLGGDGRMEPIAWTRAGTDDAWLVLDRNAIRTTFAKESRSQDVRTLLQGIQTNRPTRKPFRMQSKS